MTPKYLKVSDYAKLIGKHPRTVYRNFHNGNIEGFQDPATKTVYIKNPEYKTETPLEGNRAILYARVSSRQNSKSLDGQIERMRGYAAAKGYTVVDEVKEIASGLNDNRPKLNKLLNRNDYNILLVEHKDRLTRFGFNYLDQLLKRVNIKVEVINKLDNKDDEMMDDFISIITSFCNRIYGRKRKAKTEKIIEDIRNETTNN